LEQHIGAEAVAHFSTEERRCADPYRTQLVRSILSELVESAPPSPYDFNLDNPTVNALAAPGGQIVVFEDYSKRQSQPNSLPPFLPMRFNMC